jgi:hypothetical protein
VLFGRDNPCDGEVMQFLKIAAKCAAAALLIGVGTVMIPLPGPGIPLVLGGIALLATEFNWAASLQSKLVALWRRVTGRVARA